MAGFCRLKFLLLLVVLGLQAANAGTATVRPEVAPTGSVLTSRNDHTARSKEGREAQNEFEFVSARLIQKLNTEFDQGKITDQEPPLGEWVCDLFGARSRWQMEKGIPLYSFHRHPRDGELLNRGAHPVKSYDSTLWQGARGRVTDEVRRLNANEIISRLSSEVEDGSRVTLAFSRCRKKV